MRLTRVRLHLLTFFVLAVAATGAIAGCLADGDGGPSLNPQPLPPQPPDEERGGEAPTAPPGSFDGPSGEDSAGSSSSSSGSSGSTVEGDGGADAAR